MSAEFKVGDKVTVRSIYSPTGFVFKSLIEKINGHGHILIAGHTDKYRVRDGKRVGDTGYHAEYLLHLTDELEQQVSAELAGKNAIRISRDIGEKLLRIRDTEKALQVVDLIPNQLLEILGIDK